MKTILKLKLSVLLVFTCISCSSRISGRYTVNVSPPFSDYHFYLGHFVYKVNGDVYGEYGKGKAKIKNDSLILVFKDSRKQETEISYKTKTENSNKLKHSFKFRIVDSEDKFGMPGAKIEFFDKDDNVICMEMTDYDGEAEVDLDTNDKIEKILVSFLGFETIEIFEDFSVYNEFSISWDSGWMKYITNTTEKYKVLELNKHLIKLESSDQDTFALVRKRIIRRLENNQISHQDFSWKVKKK